MRTVIDLAEALGYRWYHTHRSDRSPSGFPDLILCRDDRVLAVELKRETGRVSPTQAEWLNALRLAGIACYVWRPSSWNEIVDVLGNRKEPTMRTTGTVKVAINLEILTCCHPGCGMTFAVPAWWEEKRREDHSAWWCPNGHGQSFTPGASEAEKLRKELASVNGNLKFLEQRLASEKGYSASLERSRSALRGVATRLRAKGKVGECLFCNRHFADLAAHVAEQHPDVDPEKVDEEETAE